MNHGAQSSAPGVAADRGEPTATPHPTGQPTKSGRASPLFDGFLLGGFECSCQTLQDGRRLDLLAATRHDELVSADYARLATIGATGCRDGASWVTAASRSGTYDFTRVTRMLHAADRNGMQVIWDLLHFGWPSDVDPFSPSFPSRFARYASAFARWFANETDQRPMITPVNEISFLSWAGGDVRCMNPFEAGRGVELKAQLVRATIEAIEAIRAVLPDARFLQPEPVIHIVRPPDRRNLWARVESDEILQYQAWDMLTGRVWPSLGGDPRYLDIVGVNFYPNNQFTPDGETVVRGDVRYKPFAKMLLEVSRRYERPMIVAETGSEGDERAPWLRYIAGQCDAALRHDCELHGVTLYPVVNHPGWVDERHCHNGLWDYPDDRGDRTAYAPLFEELQRQKGRLHAARAAMLARRDGAASGSLAVGR